MKKLLSLILLVLNFSATSFAQSYVKYEMSFGLNHSIAFDGVHAVSDQVLTAEVAVGTNRDFCQIKLPSGAVLQCQYSYELYGRLVDKRFSINKLEDIITLMTELKMPTSDLSLISTKRIGIRTYWGPNVVKVNLDGINDRVYELNVNVVDQNPRNY